MTLAASSMQGQQSRTVLQARALVKDWVTTNLDHWPGLRAAHFVGGITSMQADAPFPAGKDIDLHLVFSDDSPALQPTGPFMNIIETTYGGVIIEAGLKPVSDYRSPETVLANPEVAYHLTTDCVIHDQAGDLARLRDPVRAGYAQRRWVQARLDSEWSGATQVLATRPMAQAHYGAAGEWGVLGFSTTFVTGAFGVANLAPPRIGSHNLVHLRGFLAACDRLDLYEETLTLIGLDRISPARVAELLPEGAALFDRAVAVRRSPHPFQHKLHAHLRPYFVTACQDMLDEGYPRESLGWLAAFYLSSADVLMADGPAEERPRAAARSRAFLEELGLSDAACDAAFNRAVDLYGRLFTLAREVADRNPAIVG